MLDRIDTQKSSVGTILSHFHSDFPGADLIDHLVVQHHCPTGKQVKISNGHRATKTSLSEQTRFLNEENNLSSEKHIFPMAYSAVVTLSSLVIPLGSS